MYDMIISGYYGFENSGDDAILLAILTELRKRKPDVKILVLSNNPMATREQYQVDAMKRTNLFSIWRTMRHATLFINGGGSLIQDVTSSRSIMYYLGITWLAKKAGMRVMLYANGIGPVNKPRNRSLTARILNQCDFITLRENSSAEELRTLGVTNPTIEVTADPALNLTPCADERAWEFLQESGVSLGSKLIGFSIRDWKRREDFVPKVAQLADHMAEQYGATPVFLCLHHPKDIEIADEIRRKMRRKACIVRRKASAEEMLGMIHQMKLLLGMRLHALIYAAATDTPAIGLVYDPKIQAFLEYVGQEYGGNVEQLDYAVLQRVTEELWNRSLKASIADGDRLRMLAEKNADIALGLLK